MDAHQHQYQPVSGAAGPAAPYAVGVPVYPVVGEGGGVMWVNGVPQPLSRRSSRVAVAAAVFATCVVPLIIVAAVLFTMPDVDAILGSVGAVPASDVPSVVVPLR